VRWNKLKLVAESDRSATGLTNTKRPHKPAW